MLERVWRKGNPAALWVRMEIGAATGENSTEIPQKIKNRTTIQSNKLTSGYTPKGNEIRISKRYLHFHIHFSIIHKSQDMETT